MVGGMKTPLAILLALVASAADARRDPLPNPYPGYASAIYADPAHWLCRPDKDDVCDDDMDATRIDVKGRTKVEPFRLAKKPKIDCFYVYPTISLDATGNSDLVPGEFEELFVVRQQAARLGEVCRVFAPVYRQVTLTALLALIGGQPVTIDRDLTYGDVVDAWKHYVANDSEGRGVVLIGHSQGAGLLTTLLREEIDPHPEIRERVVSAMVLGTSFQVPVGADVGGDLASMPLCRAPKQTGCVISYASFRSTVPPPANSRFGVSREPGLQAACTNPAALRGGKAKLRPYLPTDARALPLGEPTPPVWVEPPVEITTPFVTLPKWVEAECAETNGFVHLSIIGLGKPEDARADDLTGADITPDWGLHLVDANIAMGDLVTVAKNQSQAYCKKHYCR
jgi:hypothetical protein